MKMSIPAFSALHRLFETHNLLDPRSEKQQIYLNEGLTTKRFRWDQFWRIPLAARQNWFDNFQIYQTMNDDHIDTALRVIFPPIRN